MSRSKVTIYGFENWFQGQNKSLFDFLKLPIGIDRQTLIDNIMIKAGEFDLVYDSPDFMRESIRVWSAKWFETFRKWDKALKIEYDPLYNYDRHEEWDEDGSGTSTGHSDTSGLTTDKVSAFNSSEFENSSQNVGNSSSDSDGSSETHNKRVGRAYGNIGVTTSQQMLESELTIASWNLIEHITDIFLQEYVIPVY